MSQHLCTKFMSRNYQRDGPMTVTNNQGGAPNYFPNSFSGPQPNRWGLRKRWDRFYLVKSVLTVDS